MKYGLIDVSETNRIAKTLPIVMHYEKKIKVHPEFAYFMMLETGRFRIIFVWKSTYPTRRKVLCPQAFCTMVSVFEVINT